MNPTDLVLIIHHHHRVYQDEQGELWLSATLGRWVNAIARQIREVRLLLHESPTRLPQHDTKISQPNVRLFSLGPYLPVQKTLERNRLYRQVGETIRLDAHGLLIRGVTPRQLGIWKVVKTPNKAFLLVGDLMKAHPNSPDANQWLNHLVSYFRRYEVRQMAENGTVMLANSPFLVTELEELFQNKAFFVPTNSFSENEIQPFEVREPSIPRKLLYCGRIDLEKGLRELFQATARLVAEGLPIQLDIVGPANQSTDLILRQLADQLSIAPLIHWHGPVPYGLELFKFYQQADIFVLPSYSEGFPHVIWEAAANGCPVVSTSVGGIAALWQNEVHGLLIPPKDTEALVRAMNRILTDSELRLKMAREAYQLASSYTVEACARRLIETLARQWN